jgi:excisionase family DNA binding protein
MNKDISLKTSNLDKQRSNQDNRLKSQLNAGSYLGISFWSVRTLIIRGELPIVRMGRRILIDVHDLDAWIDKNKERLS